MSNAQNVRTTSSPSGRAIPVLGQGTWRMGENSSRHQAEVAAIRLGLDLGMTLIDTAEMYAEGGAEEVVGEAIADRRDEVFVVTKVYPHNATRRGAIAACERSLQRLKTDRIELYLLHWRGDVALGETLDAFQQLKQEGKVVDYGVSNFDVDDMEEAFALPGGDEIAANQVLYSLVHRGIEFDLLPWCRERGVPLMAYSPLGVDSAEQKRILGHKAVNSVAARHNATPAQIALAWILRHPEMIVIPKASSPEHIRENREAHDIKLTNSDLAELDHAFPPPARKVPLETS